MVLLCFLLFPFLGPSLSSFGIIEVLWLGSEIFFSLNSVLAHSLIHSYPIVAFISTDRREEMEKLHWALWRNSIPYTRIRRHNLMTAKKTSRSLITLHVRAVIPYNIMLAQSHEQYCSWVARKILCLLFFPLSSISPPHSSCCFSGSVYLNSFRNKKNWFSAIT